MTHLSGRPEPGEYAPYAAEDIAQVSGEDIIPTLAAQGVRCSELFAAIDEGRASSYAYAPGKWTQKQILGHLIDDERIFVYRMLCVARGDQTPLPGFDENDYVRFGHFEERSLLDLLEEYRATRLATLAFLRGVRPQAWLRRGTVNGYEASIRGLAFHVAGHELHHLRVMAERYQAD